MRAKGKASGLIKTVKPGEGIVCYLPDGSHIVFVLWEAQTSNNKILVRASKEIALGHIDIGREDDV